MKNLQVWQFHYDRMLANGGEHNGMGNSEAKNYYSKTDADDQFDEIMKHNCELADRIEGLKRTNDFYFDLIIKLASKIS